jgi:hypothetical protein
LGQKHFEDIDHVYDVNSWVGRSFVARLNGSSLTEHGRPCLVDHVQTDRAAPGCISEVRTTLQLVQITSAQLIDVGVEDFVHEANTRRLEWILVRQFYVDLPDSISERS